MQNAVYQKITDRVTRLLSQDLVPWHQPWAGNGASCLPQNLLSKRPYRGCNVWLLGSAGYSSPYWLSFNQAKGKGGRIRKGEEGWPAVFWKVGEAEDEDGKSRKTFLLRYYTVFNLEQTEGIEIPQVNAPGNTLEPLAQCEALVASMPHRPGIRHEASGGAFYRQSTDKVHMPNLQRFDNAEEYYSTLFHELTHSTGHKDRLNRPTLVDMVRFGDTNYSKEELVAEMGAAFLCGIAGIENRTINNSAAYIKGWLKKLKDDVRLFVQAGAQAQRAVDFILGQQQEVSEE